ncbi:MAG: hypothetical protein IJ896_13700 [Fibrobacter sp.]|nr:hypothetical protein [Fibrobacter sp.]
MNYNKGTSVILLNTTPGSMLFESVADKVVQCDSKIENAIAGNPCIVRSSEPHPKRAEFFANLDKYTLDQLIKKYCPFPSPLKRAYIRVRGGGMLGRMGKLTPQKIPAKNGADLLTTALRLCIFDSEQMCR